MIQSGVDLKMVVPLIDLKRHHAPHEESILARWAQILDSGSFVSGGYVKSFEAGFAGLHEVDHAVAVANGTVALELIMRALGIGAGDRVIVPTSTFIATAEAVSNAGGSPLFVDCEAETGNIDLDQAVSAMHEPDVRAVIPVHLYGHPVDMDPLLKAAADSNVLVVEDAAQAHAARYRDRRVGGLGVAAGFSFYPGKNLGAPGEGGAVTTNDRDLARRIRLLSSHGEANKYESEVIGTNARMMELVAAMLDLKLSRLDEVSDGRRRVAAYYRRLLGDVDQVVLPTEHPWATPVYHLFVVEVDPRRRAAILEHFDRNGIGHGIHYPVPLHLQPAYRYLGHERGDFPVAEARASAILSLPMFPEMTDSEIDRVVAILSEALSK